MLRVFALATLCLAITRSGAPQELTVLHIKVALIDAEQKATPVPRHALLVSENPASAAPRRIVTGAGWHSRREAAARELHRRIGPPLHVSGQGLPVDEDD